ncbi:hypothetical protein [Sulfuricystis thermophila]|uniref:hypothetical protein n=1 Tax=Sulfuricystis thermophila TaxID=2496847 RepID=UPI001036D392|nr:hypothetical protein [Sulfuricystis thermophila]
MQTFDRPALPTATAREHRLRLFQPTRRPRPLRDVEIATPWGRLIITGRLGQSHADVMDAICYHAERRVDMNDGRIKLLVDPARVRRACRLGGEQLEKIARELREATIQIKEPQEIACIGGLVDHIDTALRADGSPITRHNPLRGGERELWRVELGKALCKLIARDAWVGYDPAPIARLQHGISQAVARHVLSHKTAPAGGWRLDTLIAAAAGEVGGQALWDKRRELRADAGGLAAVGVLLDGERVRRLEQTPGGMEQTPGGMEQTPGGSRYTFRCTSGASSGAPACRP